MGLFGRLFGSRGEGAAAPASPAPIAATTTTAASPPTTVPASPTPTVPPANTVVIPSDLAAQLTATGLALNVAVEAACRVQLAAAVDSGAMPFWLDRSEPAPSAGRGDIEDELRDRVIERHSSEGAG